MPSCSKPKRSKPILVLKTDNSNQTVRRMMQIEKIVDAFPCKSLYELYNDMKEQFRY
jgi:hypothetical protein